MSRAAKGRQPELEAGRIEARNVSRSFRILHERNLTLKETVLRGRRTRATELWALRDVSLDIAPGEALAVIGQNGSGKSTLLKVLAGIIRPQSGSVAIGGSVAAMLELGAGFHPDFTGRENVYMNGTINGLSSAEIEGRFDEIVAFSELEEFIDMPVRTYSSGMQMRLAFSVASHVNPDVLLLDEVLAVGDASFQQKCMKRIYDFRRGGGTLVFVSHDPGSVESICDRAVLIVHGEIVDEGVPQEVLTTYSRMLAEPDAPLRRGSGAATDDGTHPSGGGEPPTSTEARLALANLADRGLTLLAACTGEDTGGMLATVGPVVTSPIDDLPTRALALSGDEQLLRLLESGEELGSGPGEMLVYDATGVSRYLRIDELGGAAALLADDRSVAVAVPSLNAVVWLGPSGDVVRRWTAPGAGDAWHVNGLCRDAGGRLVGSAFGRFDRDRDWWGEAATGQGLLFDAQTGEDVVTGLTRPVDPHRLPGGWLLCEASERRLTRVPDEGGAHVHLPLLGFACGLALDGDLAFVGESWDRYVAPDLAAAAIAVVSIPEWRVIGRVPLPRREVRALAIVPEPLAEGLRAGFRVNPSRVLEQDQRDLFRQAGVEPERIWANGDPLPADGFRVRMLARPPFAPLAAGRVATIDYTIINRSDYILASAPPHPVHVSYRWLPVDGRAVEEGEPVRSLLPALLPPRGQLRGSAKIITPSLPGEYTLRLTLVQELIAWFDVSDPANSVDIPVDVVASATGAALGARVR